ncbi:hypothetical protein L21SP4_01980 [Kiritimatiella glycovorans]|uniref:Uncharacterized protein n=1 Tax=Kiritimatiella glycovorans TaxID=1307763 RepID=A0A0G3EK73_9BACT|nr:hypothetical protein L21SP4_01980 [Kiritimatiella glycovorans]
MQRDTTGKSSQGWLSLDCESDLGVYNLSTETPTQNMEMMERIVLSYQLLHALGLRRSKTGIIPNVTSLGNRAIRNNLTGKSDWSDKSDLCFNQRIHRAKFIICG